MKPPTFYTGWYIMDEKWNQILLSWFINKQKYKIWFF
jgi:hypothetical protein